MVTVFLIIVIRVSIWIFFVTIWTFLIKRKGFYRLRYSPLNLMVYNGTMKTTVAVSEIDFRKEDSKLPDENRD